MKKFAVVCALLPAALLAGCGGGGSGGVSTGAISTGASRASVLVTDSPRDDFAHVWATIYHVELVPQTGSPVVLFDDATGRQIDLKTLRDASGQRFSFLGSATIPAGTYKAINVTIGATVQLYKNGVASGSPIAVATTIPKDASGHPVITATFNAPKTISAGTTSNLVVDFDLARFIVTDSQITPVIVDASGGPTVSDPARHNPDHYHGTVSNLTGTTPTLTFTLNRGTFMKVTVTTTASTALYGTTTLANGSIVDVQGTLDTTTQNLVATSLEVQPAGTAPTEGEGTCPPGADGAATNLNATAGTFTLAASHVRGFTTTQTTVNVVTNSKTVFRGDAGATITQAAFFTALAATPTAMVQGTYDATTNTLTATEVRVDNHTFDGGGEHGPHPFRDGGGPDGWGHGVFH